MARARFLALRPPSGVIDPWPLAEERDGPLETGRSASNGEGSSSLTRAGIFWSAEGNPGVTESFYGSGKYVAAAAWTQAFARCARIPRVDLFAPLTGIAHCHRQLEGMPANAYGTETATA